MSVAEQFLANLSWKSWSQAKDLHKRIFFTLGILIVYRLGTYVPLPGVNPEAMRALAKEYGGQGLLNMFNLVSGGALERMSVFALNLMPYISSSIIVQLLTALLPYFMALKKEGESGKRKLNQYTRYGTVGLASFQAVVLASVLMSRPGVVYEPGSFFYVTTIVTIVGATLFLMWLGEQITARGIGNGSSMIIYAGIMANLPGAIAQTLEMGRMGNITPAQMIFTGAAIVAIIAFIVFMERAYRKVTVQYPRRQMGQQVYGAEQTYMPLKLNTTGVLPPIFAATILGFFDTLMNWPLLKKVPFLGDILGFALGRQGLGILFVQATLIIFFSFFYTTIVFNPEETAESLRKNGAFIPGYRPGAMTAGYFVYLLNRLTVLGSGYIAFIVILPALVNWGLGLNFPFQGTSFLISVSVSLELISQVHSYIISHQYGDLLRKQGKGRVPTRGGVKS
jgi:preprotein translocase subunit SecY